MDEDQVNDLKQFIAAAVSQTEARLSERLEQKVDGGFDGVGDAFVGQSNDRQDELDQRLTKLEQQAA